MNTVTRKQLLDQLNWRYAARQFDACPMEGFSRDEYDRILGLTELGLGSAVVATPGYQSSEDKYGNAPKVRFDREEVIQYL